MKSLAEIFQEADGSFSFIRVILFIVVAGVITKNLYLTIHTGNDVTLDFKEVLAMIAALGAKVAQKPFEKPAPPSVIVS